MVILASKTFCIWQYYATIVLCLVSIILCCYTKAINKGKSDCILEVHIFRNEVGVIAEAVLAVHSAPACLRNPWPMKTASEGIMISSIVRF